MTAVWRESVSQMLSGPIATVTVLVKTVSEANSHTFWRARQQRAKEQRRSTWVKLRSKNNEIGHAVPPLRVHLVRLASRKLDSDNLQGALKHVRDGVADWLGIDDGDESKVTWTYDQETGHKVQAVRVEFYRRTT